MPRYELTPSSAPVDYPQCALSAERIEAMDWEVGVIAAVNTPEHRAGYRWFVVPTFPRVPIVYTETREQAQAIIAELRRLRVVQS